MGQGGYTLDSYHLWQPFTQMKTFLEDEGIIIERGEGALLYDVQGKEYINMTSSVWNVPCGLGRSEIADAIHQQLTQLGYGSLLRAAHPKAIELAALLADLAPGGLNRVFFTSNGSESIETGIKMARHYFWAKGSNKHKVISLHGAYHGCSYGALSASGFEEDKQPYGPLVPGFIQITPPRSYQPGVPSPDQSLAAAELERVILAEGPETVALFLLEPIQGMGGIHVPSQEFFDAVVQICRKYEVLLMLDEVTTGFGRTGLMFAAEHWGVEPDLLALGKAMSGGYWPLGATIATDEIWEQFLGDDNTSRFNHGSTFSGHPGGSVAGLVNLRAMMRDRTWETAAQRGRSFLEQLQELRDYSIVGDVRGLGMMFAVEFVEDRETGVPLSPQAMRMLVMACFASGVWVHVAGSTLIFMPPLNIQDELLSLALKRLRRVIRSAQSWSLGRSAAA